MAEFLNIICAPTVWVIAVLEFILLCFMVFRFVKTKSKITLVTALITVGLFYDAFIIALGTVINPEGAPFISQMRFISHGLLIPLLFVVCSLALDLKKPWKYVVYGVTLVLMIMGLAEGIATNLTTANVGGLIRMLADKELTPKWAQTISTVLSFGTVFPLIGVGIYTWVKQKNSWLFWSGFAMFLFSMIGPMLQAKEYIFFLSMFGEILMVAFMIVYAIKKEKKVI